MSAKDSVLRSRSVWGWALYDWANSAYTTSIVTVFFPIFFKMYWAAGASATEGTFYLGMANAIAGVFVALASPILGAIADSGWGKKKFLFIFLFFGVISTLGLSFVDQGHWVSACGFFVIATIGFTGSITFYDSLLPGLVDKSKLDFVSGFGFSIGYLGGGLLLIVNALMAMKPELFGLADKVTAVKAIFVSVAIWWALFSIPLFFWVKESKEKSEVGFFTALSGSLTGLKSTLGEIVTHKTLATFLLAYFFYMDGVSTIIKMAVSYGKDLGIADGDLIKAVVLVQFVGFPAALIFGKLGEKVGAKAGILVGIGVYALITLWGSIISQPWEFYAIAGLIGCVQGGVQSLSRSAYCRLIPDGKAAEYFGFYSLFSKFSSILGPLIMGVVGLVTGNSRLSIVAVLLLFIVGAALLMRIPAKEISHS